MSVNMDGVIKLCVTVRQTEAELLCNADRHHVSLERKAGSSALSSVCQHPCLLLFLSIISHSSSLLFHLPPLLLCLCLLSTFPFTFLKPLSTFHKPSFLFISYNFLYFAFSSPFLSVPVFLHSSHFPVLSSFLSFSFLFCLISFLFFPVILFSPLHLSHSSTAIFDFCFPLLAVLFCLSSILPLPPLCSSHSFLFLSFLLSFLMFHFPSFPLFFSFCPSSTIFVFSFLFLPSMSFYHLLLVIFHPSSTFDPLLTVFILSFLSLLSASLYIFSLLCFPPSSHPLSTISILSLFFFLFSSVCLLSFHPHLSFSAFFSLSIIHFLIFPLLLFGSCGQPVGVHVF